MSDINSLISSLKSAQIAGNEVVLSFEGRQLKLMTAEDAEPIAKEIESLPLLQTLVFKGNTVNYPAAERISESLKICKNLKRALWSDMFTGRSKLETPPALKFLCSGMTTAQAALVELDLSDNALSVAGAEAIKNFLSSPSCYTLEILKLNNDGLGIGGGKIIAGALTECWEASKSAGKPLSLKVFIAGRNRLEIQGAEALAGAFKKIGTLEEVSMPQNGIYHRGIAALCDAFAQNPNLKHINLSDNTFTAAGAISFAKIIPNLKKLEVLNISDCLIRSQGGLHLAKALKTNCPNLKELNVSGNEMNKEATLFLADAVTSNKNSFLKLEIDCNNVGHSGIEELKDIFRKKDALNKLGSLSDDEGSANEEENENEEAEAEQYESSEEEENKEEAEAEQTLIDEILNVKLQSLADQNAYEVPPAVVDISTVVEKASSENVVEKFLRTFDGATLCEIGESAPDLIVQNLLTKLYNSEFVVDILDKISSLITTHCSPNVKNLAALTCKQILSTSFMLCDVPLFNDYLAAKLGLIKSEDKSTTTKNIYGFIFVLEKECSQDYFNKTTRDVLKFLIDRHLKKLNVSERPHWLNLLNALSS